MSELVIADTSCLIVLEKIGQLELLSQLFQKITITPEIQEEFGNILPSWIHIEPVLDKKRQQLLELELDKGESSAIALALEKEANLLLIDERKGRNIATQLKINITGTLGILIRAKEEKLIHSLRAEIAKLVAIEFRMSQALIQDILGKYEPE